MLYFDDFENYRDFKNLDTKKLQIFNTKIDIKTEWWLLEEIFAVSFIGNKLVYLFAPITLTHPAFFQKYFNSK